MAVSQRFADAHRALRDDPSVQFALKPATPPHPPETPAWLKSFLNWLGDVLAPVGRLFRWITAQMPAAPYARILLWAVIGCAALALIWLVVERVRYGSWTVSPKRRKARAIAVAAEEDWTPDAAPARAWLDEADALAARGLYAEAVHHLLLRSVDDIQLRRPRVFRPSLTSRELTGLAGIPVVARDLFARIAKLVERSLFGGGAVSADEWHNARAAYADFALPGQWRG
ncbi:MAG: DUF4129 domain-containing protein [Pseudomonadota bacterium]